MKAPSGGIVEALRNRTAQLHAQLEASDFILPATRDKARFAKLIGAMLSFHRAIEPELQRFEIYLSQLDIDIKECFKTKILEAESERFRAPLYRIPQISFVNAAEAVGAYYVLEGSSLGGLQIAKSLKNHLDIESLYYRGDIAAVKIRWPKVMRQLESFARDSTERESICRGAETTFNALHDHLAMHLDGTPYDE
jgi:heme oxygenase